MATSSLIDPVTGKPIEYDRLAQEESGPTMAGVRQIVSDHPWQGMTPSRLGQVMRAAEMGNADAYLEVAEEIEEKDLHYRAVISTRKLQVCEIRATAPMGLRLGTLTATGADSCHLFEARMTAQ